jgi:hypothetical protein
VGRGPTEEEKVVIKKLRRALHQEEIWMRQRSCVALLREGEKNTSYFHQQAAQRRRINKIEFLERADGSTCESMAENKEEVQGFYQGLYHSQGFREMTELLDFVQPRITQQMNKGMDADFSKDEVRNALF